MECFNLETKRQTTEHSMEQLTALGSKPCSHVVSFRSSRLPGNLTKWCVGSINLFNRSSCKSTLHSHGKYIHVWRRQSPCMSLFILLLLILRLKKLFRVHEMKAKPRIELVVLQSLYSVKLNIFKLIFTCELHLKLFWFSFVRSLSTSFSLAPSITITSSCFLFLSSSLRVPLFLRFHFSLFPHFSLSLHI
jgi:hypothetical protein